ncbi:hypothetical protein GGR52DRAFT_381115 [Hypoxylon sp. FL1284]|nr:hypothetical protein GGR52DRAFT_381115 [Hypoxylon sp. FL1284]
MAGSSQNMEQGLEERPVLADQDKRKTTSQIDSLPAGSRETGKKTGVLLLHRPWATHSETFDSYLQKEDCWKARDGDEDILERWLSQPMTSEPYNNVKVIIVQIQDSEDKSSSVQVQVSQGEEVLSEIAAASGSG